MTENRMEIESTGAVVFNRRIVGEFDFSTKTLVLNAAWCRLAGLGFRIDGDNTDRRKVLVDRSNQPEKVRKPDPVGKQEEALPGVTQEPRGKGIPEDGAPADPYAHDPIPDAEPPRDDF